MQHPTRTEGINVRSPGIISNILSHEEHDKDVGDGNKEQNDTGKDQKVSGFVGPEK